MPRCIASTYSCRSLVWRNPLSRKPRGPKGSFRGKFPPTAKLARTGASHSPLPTPSLGEPSGAAEGRKWALKLLSFRNRLRISLHSPPITCSFPHLLPSLLLTPSLFPSLARLWLARSGSALDRKSSQSSLLRSAFENSQSSFPKAPGLRAALPLKFRSAQLKGHPNGFHPLGTAGLS